MTRTGHGVLLTEAGEKFLAAATEILDKADASVREIQALRQTPAGTVVLGIPPMFAEPLLVPLVTRFSRDFPDVKLRIRESVRGYVLEWLVSGQVDVAVLYNAPRRANLSLEPLIADELMLVGAAHHGVMDVDDAIDLVDALRLPLVLPSSLHGQRGVIDAAAAGLSVQPNVQLEVDGPSSLIRFAEEGYGYTFLPFGSVAMHVARGLLGVRPIVNPAVPSVASVAMSTQRPATQAMKTLFRYVREESSSSSTARCGRATSRAMAGQEAALGHDRPRLSTPGGLNKPATTTLKTALSREVAGACSATVIRP